MAREPPKCCGCVPLRPGLLAWAYIKLVLVLALTSIGVCVYLMRYEMLHFVERIYYVSRYRSPVIYILETLWPLGMCLLLLVFAIIFIIGVHRQSYKMLLVYLVYSLFEVMLAGAAVGWQVYDVVLHLSYTRSYDSESYNRMLQYEIHKPVLCLRLILPVVLNILLPIYFIVLIKSEVQRLKTARGETPVRREPLFPVEELERLRQQLGVKNV